MHPHSLVTVVTSFLLVVGTIVKSDETDDEKIWSDADDVSVNEVVNEAMELEKEQIWTQEDDKFIDEQLAMYDAAQEIVELTDRDFQEQLWDAGKVLQVWQERVRDGEEHPWFIQFYAPGCAHCKALAPLWEELAVHLTGYVRVARVDITRQIRLAAEFDATIKGIPALKLIASGNLYSYEGDFDIETMFNWSTAGYASDTPQKLDSQKTWLDRIQDALMRFVYNIEAVHNTMPLLIPLSCVVGFSFAFLLSRACTYCARLKPPDEVFDVEVIRDDKDIAGFAINRRDMTVMSVEKDFPNLERIQAGDKVMAVNGTSITDGKTYQELAHGAKKFTVTFGRYKNAKTNPKKLN